MKRYRHDPRSLTTRIKVMFAEGHKLSRKKVLERIIEEDKLPVMLTIQNVSLYRSMYTSINGIFNKMVRDKFIRFYCVDPYDSDVKLYEIIVIE